MSISLFSKKLKKPQLNLNNMIQLEIQGEDLDYIEMDIVTSYYSYWLFKQEVIIKLIRCV